MPHVGPPTPRSIEIAVGALRAGEVVALPTETVYGLAADATNESAVRKIFALKGRPVDNPLIVHVLDAAQAQKLVTAWDERCDRLAAHFWPGPLTLVLPKSDAVPDVVTAGHTTVAVRSPAQAVMRDVLRWVGRPLAAPSANRSTGVSPTTAAHVASEFADCDDLLVLDGGPCTIGIESTVLDMTSSPPRVLRPGGVTIEALREVIGDVEAGDASQQAHSPGTSPRHYAPSTPCELVTHDELRDRLRRSDERLAVICFDPSVVPPAHVAIAMPREAERYASMMYDALRRADATGAQRILIERPALTDGLWAAIQDRLRRATAPR